MENITSQEQLKQVAQAAGYSDTIYNNDARVAAAFKIYQHASGAVENVAKNAVLVAGQHGAKTFSLPAIRGKSESEQKIGSEDIQIIFPNIVKGHRLWKDFGTMDEEAKVQGSISNAKNWSLLANDAWILGGVQSGKKFLIVSPLSWYNLIEMRHPDFKKVSWDQWLAGATPEDAATARGTMTVTTREMLGLSHFGYRIDRMGPEIITAVSSDTTKAQGATFKGYQEILEGYQGPGEVWEFFRSLEANLTFHASAHLLVRQGQGKEEVETAEGEIDRHPGETIPLGKYNLQGALLEEADSGEYMMADLQKDLKTAAANLAAANSHFDLRGANLAGPINVAQINASKAELRLACLNGVDLTGANLTGADLRATDIYGAQLAGADLAGARLSNAPVLLAPPFPGRTDMDQSLSREFVFFERAILFDYQGGAVHLAANPDGTGKVYSDDKVEVGVTPVDDFLAGIRLNRRTFDYDYSRGNSGKIWIQDPQEITHLFAGPGNYHVSLKLIDLYHNSYGSSGYYLVVGTPLPGSQLRYELAGTVWTYRWRGNDFKFAFGRSGDAEILESWKGVRWRAVNDREVVLDGLYQDHMYLNFDNSLQHFQTIDWDGQPGEGTRTDQTIP